jgi:hypothetical protein
MAYRADARSLSDRIDTLFGAGGIVLDVHPVNPNFPPHTAHFSSASLAALGLLVKQLAPSAADFPAISTAPGITYTYNPQLQAFERSSTSLGPVFVERPETIGRGKFDIGFSYLFVDFNELNGKDLDHLAFTLHHNDCCGPRPSPGFPEFENDTIGVRFQKFSLQSHVVSLSATYGITDRWDVNMLIPVVFTSLKLRARATINDTTQPPVHFFNNELRTLSEVRSDSADTTGVGDLQLRTKYHLLDWEGLKIASGLVLRVPTGEENDFQGIGDTTLTPFLSLAHEYGRINLHASTGIEINWNDSDRSRVRYAGGVTVQVLDRVALLGDVIGSSNLKTDRIAVEVPVFSASPTTFPPLPVGFAREHRSLHTDILDFAVGFKANLYGSVVGFATVFIPLNDDGLRADAIPAAGLEVSF